MKAFLILSKPYEFFPYQIKSLRRAGFKQVVCVQSGKEIIEEYVIEKFGATSLFIEQKMKQADIFDYIIYNFVINKKGRAIILNNRIILDNFEFSANKRDPSGCVYMLDPEKMDEHDSVQDGFEDIEVLKRVKARQYIYYHNGVIDLKNSGIHPSRLRVTRNDFTKFIPKIVKKDGVIDLGKRFYKERKKFKKAGKVVRTQEQINAIYEICTGNKKEKIPPCEHFRKNRRNADGKCGLCGCAINKKGLINKIKYGTTRCPVKKW